MKTDKT